MKNKGVIKKEAQIPFPEWKRKALKISNWNITHFIPIKTLHEMYGDDLSLINYSKPDYDDNNGKPI